METTTEPIEVKGELVTGEPDQKHELALPSDSSAAMLAIIHRAASDPSVDVAKMQQLLDMKERIDAGNAKKAFTEALHGFQSECPQIHRGGSIVVNGQMRSRYAPYEETMKVVQPFMQKWGFSATFDTQCDERGIISGVTCTLAHTEGHSVTSSFPVMPDKSGAKNDIQAIGSALSYGKRYSLGAVLGLVFTDEDDDGRATSALAEAKSAVAIKTPASKRQQQQVDSAEIKRDADIATIRKMMADAKLEDEDVTVSLNVALESDLPHWTDASDKVIARLATTEGFAKATKSK